VFRQQNQARTFLSITYVAVWLKTVSLWHHCERTQCRSTEYIKNTIRKNGKSHLFQ